MRMKTNQETQKPRTPKRRKRGERKSNNKEMGRWQVVQHRHRHRYKETVHDSSTKKPVKNRKRQKTNKERKAEEAAEKLTSGNQN